MYYWLTVNNAMTGCPDDDYKKLETSAMNECSIK